MRLKNQRFIAKTLVFSVGEYVIGGEVRTSAVKCLLLYEYLPSFCHKLGKKNGQFE